MHTQLTTDCHEPLPLPFLGTFFLAGFFDFEALADTAFFLAGFAADLALG